jgi:ferredoxin-nitrate reductase
VVFVPFRYGYFDVDREDRVPQAANELTVTAWPVSKQPLFKVAAVRVAKIDRTE